MLVKSVLQNSLDALLLIWGNIFDFLPDKPDAVCKLWKTLRRKIDRTIKREIEIKKEKKSGEKEIDYKPIKKKEGEIEKETLKYSKKVWDWHNLMHNAFHSNQTSKIIFLLLIFFFRTFVAAVDFSPQLIL